MSENINFKRILNLFK